MCSYFSFNPLVSDIKSRQTSHQDSQYTKDQAYSENGAASLDNNRYFKNENEISIITNIATYYSFMAFFYHVM